MADPVEFPGQTGTLRAPAGREDSIRALPTFSNGVCSVSCWALRPLELLRVVRTGRVWLSVFSGRSQPPVYLGDEESVRGLVVDFGPVWPTQEGPDDPLAAAFAELIEIRDRMPEAQGIVVPTRIVDAIIGGKHE